MNLWFRMLRVLLASPWAARKGIFEESRLTFRVWPSDCDINFHMNNGRYLTLMDLGRTHLMAQLRVLWQLPARRWYPVVGSVDIQFARALPPFRKFELVTRLLTWDEKWFYVEQRFEVGGRVCATAHLRALFLGRQGRVPTGEIVRLAVSEPVVPPAHEIAGRWRDAGA